MEDITKEFMAKYGAYLTLTQQLCTVFYIVFWIALIFWTWRDADRRGAMPWFWAIAVGIFSVFGWAIYMVVRPPEYADDALERDLEIRAREAEIHRAGATCPSCMKPIDSDYLMCPYCMKKLKKPCVSCGRPMRMSWGVCPYCKAKQPAAETATSPSKSAPPAPRPPREKPKSE